MDSSITKKFTGNSSAIVTAIITLLAILYYLFGVIPNNKIKIDNDNKEATSEIAEMIASILQDQANAVGKGRQNYYLNLIKVNHNNVNFSNVVLQSVLIDSIEVNNTQDQKKITLSSNIVFKVNDSLVSIRKTDQLDYSELMKRINITSSKFKYWAVAFDKKPFFLSNNISQSDIDSVKSKLKDGVVELKSQSKRFYSSKLNIKDTDFFIYVYTAIDNEDYESLSKRIDLHQLLMISFLLFLLLLSLPLIKPLISSYIESLSQSDLYFAVLAIVCFILVCTVMSVSYYLYTVNINGKKLSLRNYNAMIEQSLGNELKIYRDASRSVHHSYSNSMQMWNFVDSSYFKNLDKDWPSTLPKKLQYFFTINKNAETDKVFFIDRSVFSFAKSYKDRDYYEDLSQSNYCNSISTVYSRIDNNLKIAYIETDSNAIVPYRCVVYTPSFLESITMPRNKKFMLVNSKGLVLYHTDMERSRLENVFNTCGFFKESISQFGIAGECTVIGNYNGANSLFYLKQLDKSISDTPVYLITFETIEADEIALLNSILTGTILSIALGIFVLFLSYLFSAIYLHGSVPFISKTHIYWLFPDWSKVQEYAISFFLNLLLMVIGIALLLFHNNKMVYYLVILFIHAIYIHFLLINQREYAKIDGSFLKSKLFILIVSTIILNVLITWILLMFNFQLLSVIATILILGTSIYLYANSKISKTDYLVSFTKRPSYQKWYIRFLSSSFAIHFLILPFTITTVLFLKDYKYLEKTSSGVLVNTLKDRKTSLLSTKHLSVVWRNANEAGVLNFDHFCFQKLNLNATAFLFLGLLLLLIILRGLLKFYRSIFFIDGFNTSYLKEGLGSVENQFLNQGRDYSIKCVK